MATNPRPVPSAEGPKKSGIGFMGVALTLLGIVLVAAVVYMITSWEPGVAPRSAMNPNGPEAAAPAPVQPAP